MRSMSMRYMSMRSMSMSVWQVTHAHHEVGVTDVVFDDPAADDHHPCALSLHRHRVQSPQIYQKSIN